MALKPKPKSEFVEPEVIAPEVIEILDTHPVRIQVLAGRLRHPVTGVLFAEGRVVEILDLNSVDNTFVRHQIEAGLFKVID